MSALHGLPLASIPSPSSSTLELGPFSIHFYGLTLLVAIIAAVVITGIRWTRRGGDWDLIFRLAVWGVAFGIIGARLYHVVTSWDELPDEWWGPFAIWKGGLGVWGGIGLGAIVGAIVAHRSGASVARLADCVAPGLLVAQGIGRFGNWWNQELFGRPTDLPWGLEIDCSTADCGQYFASTTFHPTFLYEALWCFAAAGALLLIERRFRIRPGGLFALYVLLYSIGRLWIELLRIDPSHEVGGIRLNVFVAGAEWGRVRALVDDRGNQIEEAGPSVPVEVVGIQGTPSAGDDFNVVDDEARAREISEYRRRQLQRVTHAAGARGVRCAGRDAHSGGDGAYRKDPCRPPVALARCAGLYPVLRHAYRRDGGKTEHQKHFVEANHGRRRARRRRGDFPPQARGRVRRQGLRSHGHRRHRRVALGRVRASGWNALLGRGHHPHRTSRSREWRASRNEGWSYG